MIAGGPKHVVITMSSGKTFNGWLSEAEYNSLMGNVGKADGATKVFLFGEKPNEQGEGSGKRLTLRNASIESVEG